MTNKPNLTMKPEHKLQMKLAEYKALDDEANAHKANVPISLQNALLTLGNQIKKLAVIIQLNGDGQRVAQNLETQGVNYRHLWSILTVTPQNMEVAP